MSFSVFYHFCCISLLLAFSSSLSFLPFHISKSLSKSTLCVCVFVCLHDCHTHKRAHTHTCTERTLRPSRWWPYSFFPRLTLTIHYRPQTKPIPHPPPCDTYTHTSTHAKCPIILPLGRWRSQNLACPSVSVDTLSFQTVPALLWLNLLTFLIPSPWLKFLLLHFSNPQQEWGASDDSLYYPPPASSPAIFFF